MSISIRAMSIGDYRAVAGLWRQTEGIGLNESETESAVDAFLQRNPGMSAVALSSSKGVLGAVLCGHDGRRGYLHHLAVAAAHRRQGIATRLIAWCFDRLAAEGIPKCNIFLFRDNDEGGSFWRDNGWSAGPDLHVFQKVIGSAK